MYPSCIRNKKIWILLYVSRRIIAYPCIIRALEMIIDCLIAGFDFNLSILYKKGTLYNSFDIIHKFLLKSFNSSGINPHLSHLEVVSFIPLLYDL